MPIINISEYKMELLTDIFNNPTIVEALGSQSPKYIPDEPDSLINNNLFPYLRVPGTQDEADTYILIATDVIQPGRVNPTYSKYRVTIWVLSHQSRMDLKGKNATRIDYISTEICKMFEGKTKFGFSELTLDSNAEMILNETYQYREIVFHCSDLRKSACISGR